MLNGWLGTWAGDTNAGPVIFHLGQDTTTTADLCDLTSLGFSPKHPKVTTTGRAFWGERACQASY